MRSENSNRLTIATYNIHLGGMDMNYDFGILAQDILASGATVVGMQEVDCVTFRNKKQDTMQLLARQLGWHAYYAPAERFELRHYGNGLISRYPIVAADFEILPFTGTGYEETRSLLHAVLDTGDLWLNVYVTHTEQGVIRRQLERIREVSRARDPYVIMGDFNWQEFGLFDDIFPGTTKANGMHNRLRTTADGYMFDNMIFSPSVQAENVRVLDTGHSDHSMLLADIVIGPEEPQRKGECV